MEYASIEQRMAKSYLDLLPPFIPDEAASVSVAEQQRFYDLISGLYQLLFAEPALLVPQTHDDFLPPPRFAEKASEYPGQPEMRKFLKAENELLQFMFALGQGEAPKLNKRQQAILDRLGVDVADLPAGWVWMSSRPDAHQSRFNYCLFREDRDYEYASIVYSRLLGEEAFRKLEGWMQALGYRPSVAFDTTGSDCKLILVYANPAWGEGQPSSSFEYKVKHSGVAVRYDTRTSEPAVLGLCIPNGLKPYLEAFGSAPQAVQDFIIKYAKVCNDCRYCVQTDKTGKRPLAKIAVRHAGAEHELCPYYPGFRFSWTSLDDGLVEQLVTMLGFIDRFAPGA